MDQNFSLNKDTYLCSNFRKQASQINFGLRFKRKKEGSKKLWSARVWDKYSVVSIFPFISPYDYWFSRKKSREGRGKKKVIPMETSPISWIAAMHVANSLIKQVLQPSECSNNSALEQTQCSPIDWQADMADLINVLVYPVAKNVHMNQKTHLHSYEPAH